jgi:hypothetical protein
MVLYLYLPQELDKYIFRRQDSTLVLLTFSAKTQKFIERLHDIFKKSVAFRLRTRKASPSEAPQK